MAVNGGEGEGGGRVGTYTGPKARERNGVLRPAGPLELICSCPLPPCRSCTQIPLMTFFFKLPFLQVLESENSSSHLTYNLLL